MNKEQIEKKNKDISDAIFVSQLQDYPGFLVFSEYLESLIKSLRFQDVMGLKDINVVNTQQGMVIALEDIKQYFRDKKMLALKPMVNPETGEEEILNKK